MCQQGEEGGGGPLEQGGPCSTAIHHRGSGVDRQTETTQIRHPFVVNDPSISQFT